MKSYIGIIKLDEIKGIPDSRNFMINAENEDAANEKMSKIADAVFEGLKDVDGDPIKPFYTLKETAEKITVIP